MPGPGWSPAPRRPPAAVDRRGPPRVRALRACAQRPCWRSSRWQSGDGALANVAIERALAADPEYSMAHLIGQALDAGLPPSAARLPMTPEEVEASYAGTERRRRPGGGTQGSPSGARGSEPRRRVRRPGVGGEQDGRRQAVGSTNEVGQQAAFRVAQRRGGQAGRPLSSTCTVPGGCRVGSREGRDGAGIGPGIGGPPAATRRRACAATAAAERNRVTPGSAAPIRSAASSYSVQPSTTAPQSAGVRAAAPATAALVAASSPGVDRVGQAGARDRGDWSRTRRSRR